MKWIRVEDRLPKDMDRVLVKTDRPTKWDRHIHISTFYKGEWDINGSVWPNMPKPTHWMPLPEHPIE